MTEKRIENINLTSKNNNEFLFKNYFNLRIILNNSFISWSSSKITLFFHWKLLEMHKIDTST